MTQSPKDYIASRRIQIHEQIDALNAELGDLDAMESALENRHSKGMEYRAPHQPSGQLDNAPAPVPGKRQRFEKSIKEMVLDVLENNTGLLALEILADIKNRYGVSVERTSLSPQLSRLKADDQITATDNRWQITAAGRQYLAELKLGLDIFG